MDYDAFRASLSQSAAPVDDPALSALWWAGRANWARAHAIAQDNEGAPGCDLVHAWLHRREGDLGNARYWYRRAGVPMSPSDVDAEWGEIASRLLSK